MTTLPLNEKEVQEIKKIIELTDKSIDKKVVKLRQEICDFIKENFR